MTAVSSRELADSTRPVIVRGRHILCGIDGDDRAELHAGGALLVSCGRIAELSSFEQLSLAHPGAEVFGSVGDIIMPGLVNAHHHTGLTPLQHGTPFLPLELWLPRFIGWRTVDPYLDTLYSAIEMVESGVTTVQHIHGGPTGPREAWLAAPDAIMRAYRDIGMRASYSFMWRDRNRFVYGAQEAFLASLPPELRQPLEGMIAGSPSSVGELTAHFEALHERFAAAEDGLSCVQLAPANLQWCTVESLVAQRKLAERYGVGLHMHLLETPYQRHFAKMDTGGTAVRHLSDLGLLGPNMTIGHGIWCTEADIDLLARTGTCICHNASSGLRLRSGVAPVKEFHQAGVRVALGIDQAGINDDRDMLQEMRVAWNLQRSPGHDFEPLSERQIFRMATENGAATTGFGQLIGRLEVGRAADIVVVDGALLSRPYLDGDTDIVSALVQRAKCGMIRDVLIDGRPVLRDGRIASIDKEAVLAQLELSLQRPPTEAETARRALANALHPYLRAFYQDWPMPAPEAGFRSFNARR